MLTEKPINSSLLRLGGIAGIVAIIFLPGVALQMSAGWFPELDLEGGTMNNWLSAVSTNSTMALLGVSFSIIAILSFLPLGLILHRMLPSDSWHNTAGFASYLLGTGLALATFTFGFGFTWAMIDSYNAAAGKASESLVHVATLGMRGFLVADDLATSLMGLGQLLFSLAALRSGSLPKWLCWWGVVGGMLVILVLLRYTLSVFNFAQIGYPVITLWFALTGINLLQKARQQKV